MKTKYTITLKPHNGITVKREIELECITDLYKTLIKNNIRPLRVAKVEQKPLWTDEEREEILQDKAIDRCS